MYWYDLRWFAFRPNSHRTRDAMCNAMQANRTCCHQWEYSHCMQTTSKEKRSNLRVGRIARPVWIRPQFLDLVNNCALRTAFQFGDLTQKQKSQNGQSLWPVGGHWPSTGSALKFWGMSSSLLYLQLEALYVHRVSISHPVVCITTDIDQVQVILAPCKALPTQSEGWR